MNFNKIYKQMNLELDKGLSCLKISNILGVEFKLGEILWLIF